MLYNLLYPLSVDYSILNIFKYITFRSAWALVTAPAVSILVGPYFIRWLQAIKCRQEILKEVKAHQCKAGTPTMGGLLIVFAVSVSVLLWADLTNAYVWMTMLVFIGFSAVGFIDDFMKVSHHQNKGLSPRAKFAGQMLVAGIAMLLLVSEPAYSTRLAFPFFKTLNPDLGYWYIPFAILVMVGTSNAVNLTDGLDGLAIGPMVVAGLVFSVYIYITGHVRFAQYLQLEYISGVGEVAVFCSALAGAGLGFLWFNAYPAQMFMGDVGSSFRTFTLRALCATNNKNTTHKKKHIQYGYKELRIYDIVCNRKPVSERHKARVCIHRTLERRQVESHQYAVQP